MGYNKYNEDDNDAIDDRLHLRSINIPKCRSIEPLTEYKCHYCGDIFEDKKSYFSHIKASHNHVQPLLIVGGKTAKQIAYIKDNPSVILAPGPNQAMVTIGDFSLKTDEGTYELDISEYVEQSLQSGKCRITIDGIVYWVQQYLQSEIRASYVYPIINRWEDITNKGLTLRFDATGTFNDSELEYLKAIYNYYAGCSKTCSAKDRGERYDEAFAQLSSIRGLDSLGCSILKIIAFRRNWAEKLHALCRQPDDLFNVVCDFFDDKESQNNIEMNLGMCIDEVTAESLKAVLAYQRKDWACLERLLNSSIATTVTDRNYIDRINLMRGRLEMMRGNYHRASSYFEEVASPYFQRECNEKISFCRTRRFYDE